MLLAIEKHCEQFLVEESLEKEVLSFNGLLNPVADKSRGIIFSFSLNDWGSNAMEALVYGGGMNGDKGPD